jgi:hypothetical protein
MRSLAFKGHRRDAGRTQKVHFPTFFVIDAAGEIVYRQIGIEQNASARLVNVRAQVDSLLSRPGPRVGMQLLPDSTRQHDVHPVSD